MTTAAPTAEEQLCAAFLGFGMSKRGLSIKVCQCCDGRRLVEAWAKAGGNEVEHALCSKHCQENHSRITGETL